MTNVFRDLLVKLTELQGHVLVECTEEWADVMDQVRAALATPPPEPPTIGSVEDAARAIYSEAMTWAAANVPGGAIPPWVDGGNSTAQDVARRVARSLATPPPEPPTDEEIQEWADACSEAPLEEMDPEFHGWRRCFTGEEFNETIRAALERWGN